MFVCGVWFVCSLRVVCCLLFAFSCLLSVVRVSAYAVCWFLFVDCHVLVHVCV